VHSLFRKAGTREVNLFLAVDNAALVEIVARAELTTEGFRLTRASEKASEGQRIAEELLKPRRFWTEQTTVYEPAFDRPIDADRFGFEPPRG
jgi:hypothetical protein